jgi:hypothetical protein
VLNLALFVALLALCFQAAGRLWLRFPSDAGKVALAWALGVAMFVHISNFLGVTYFGQTTMLLYMIPALIGSLAPAAAPVPVPARAMTRLPHLAPAPWPRGQGCYDQAGTRA